MKAKWFGISGMLAVVLLLTMTPEWVGAQEYYRGEGGRRGPIQVTNDCRIGERLALGQMPVQAVQGVQIAPLIGTLHLHENRLRRRLISLRHPVGMTAHRRFPVQPLQFLLLHHPARPVASSGGFAALQHCGIPISPQSDKIIVESSKPQLKPIKIHPKDAP